MSFPSSDERPGRPASAEPVGFVLGPDEGDPYHWLGSLTLTKVRGGSSGGGVDIVDHRVPAGYAPPLHVHQRSDEVFFLLDGKLEVRCGEQTWQATPGSLVFLPRGVPHGFAASGAGPARTLLINAPSGFADLVVALGDAAPGLDLPPADAPMPDPDRVARESATHGIRSASA